jgi:DNA end-binding protein Ku
MPRPVWSGAISFGLVNVPVKAYSAVHDHTVHFHQLQKGTGARIHYQKVSAATGRKVDDDDIEKGFEISKDKYVVVDDEEFEALRPQSTRSVDITDFVELESVDPIYYENTYWLGTGDSSAARAYRLLLAAMEQAQRVGIGSVVMRNKQYLAAIRPLDGALAMSTMRFADEVVPQSEIDDIPSARAKPDAKEVRLANQIIESLASEWDPRRYHDTYTEEMRDLINRKAKGKKIEAPAPEETGRTAEVVDLMAALQASLERGQKTKRAKSSRASKSSSPSKSSRSSRSKPAKRARAAG